MTAEEFGMIVDSINRTWPNSAPFDDEVVRLMAPIVSNVSREAAAAAIVSILDEGRSFAPHPTEVVRRAREIVGEFAPDDFDVVWAEIMKAVRKTGSWSTPTWSTPDVARLVESVGWKHFCESPEENLPVVRAQMRDFWTTIRARARVRDSVDRAVGGGLPDPRPQARIDAPETKRIEDGGAS